MGSQNIQLIIDAGIAMTRTALMRDGRVSNIWFGPALGDEDNYVTPKPGDTFFARVRKIDRTLKMDFLDVGGGQEVMLRHSKDHALHEGQCVRVEVTHAGRGRKKPITKLLSTVMEGNEIGPEQDQRSVLLSILEDFYTGHVGALTVSSGAVKSALLPMINDLGVPINVDPSCFEILEHDSLLDSVFSPHIGLPSGGTITIDETEALTAIDIDSAAMGAPSRNRLNEKLNREAALALMEQLQLRCIGGQIVVDFLPMPKPVVAKFNAWLREQCQQLAGFARAGWTPSGLFTFTLPRNAPSLLDQFTKKQAGQLVEGRDFTADFLLRSRLCILEEKMRAHPSARFHVKIAGNCTLVWRANPQWGQRLCETYGARVEIIHDADGISEGVVIDELN